MSNGIASGFFSVRLTKCSEYEPVGSADNTLYMNLKLMFARLGLQTALFGHSGRVDVPADMIKVDTEKGFENVLNARASLYALTTDVHDCIRDAAEYRVGPDVHFPLTNFVDDYPSKAVHSGEVRISGGVTRLYYGCVDDKAAASHLQTERNDVPARTPLTARIIPWYSPSEEILERQARLQERLHQWYEAFKRSPCGPTEDETNANLLMHYHIFTIWLDTCLSPFESAFDEFTPAFQEILRLADIFTRCKTDRPTWVSTPPLLVQGTRRYHFNAFYFNLVVTRFNVRTALFLTY